MCLLSHWDRFRVEGRATAWSRTLHVKSFLSSGGLFSCTQCCFRLIVDFAGAGNLIKAAPIRFQNRAKLLNARHGIGTLHSASMLTRQQKYSLVYLKQRNLTSRLLYRMIPETYIHRATAQLNKAMPNQMKMALVEKTMGVPTTTTTTRTTMNHRHDKNTNNIQQQ